MRKSSFSNALSKDEMDETFVGSLRGTSGGQIVATCSLSNGAHLVLNVPRMNCSMYILRSNFPWA